MKTLNPPATVRRVVTALVCQALLLLVSAPGSDLAGQVNWTRHPGNPVITPARFASAGPAFDAYHAWMPMVLPEAGLYKMWYVGYGSVRSSPAYSVGAAVSEDGIGWYKYEHNPVVLPGASGTFDEARVWGGNVLKVGGVYRMYYGGYAQGRFSIGLAESQDGVHWTKRQAPVLGPGPAGSWNPDGVSAPCVVQEDSVYKMWFSGTKGNAVAIGLAVSPDGIAWKEYAGNPVMVAEEQMSWESNFITDPRVVRLDSVYHMFYFGLSNSAVFQIGYASSTDGIAWKRYGQNPVLRIGAPGSWEEYTLSQCWVLFKDNEFKMWYGARTYSDIFRIGYASAPLTLPAGVSP